MIIASEEDCGSFIIWISDFNHDLLCLVMKLSLSIPNDNIELVLYDVEIKCLELCVCEITLNMYWYMFGGEVPIGLTMI